MLQLTVWQSAHAISKGVHCKAQEVSCCTTQSCGEEELLSSLLLGGSCQQGKPTQSTCQCCDTQLGEDPVTTLPGVAEGLIIKLLGLFRLAGGFTAQGILILRGTSLKLDLVVDDTRLERRVSRSRSM
jgi:hypothetical protein